MSIWFKEYTLEEVQPWTRHTLDEALGIEYVEIGPDYLKASMPVDHRTVQPLRMLHGGASVALAESLGSVAGTMCVDPHKQYCVGVEINANHLKSVREPDRVTGTARPLHLGRTIQVWEIRIENSRQELVCVSRITMAVREYRPGELPQNKPVNR